MIVATKHWGGVAPSLEVAVPDPPPAPARPADPALGEASDRPRSASLIHVDEALVRRAQAGDVEALCDLAAQVRPLVHRYASRFFGDPTRAEDLAQTAMMKAFSRVGDVRSPEAFPAWLLRITRNECLNELARQRHAQIPMSALDDHGLALEALADDGGDPEESLVRSQLQDLVRRVAAGLPSHYRRTLTMRALEDRSYEEISAELEIPVTVARLWYCRARKRFRRAFVESMVARRDVSGACLEMGVAIAEMIEGTLGRTDRDRVQGHLVDCAVCRQTEDELRNTAFRAPSRAFVLGLGLLRAIHHGGRTAAGLGRLPAVASRVAVSTAGGLSVVAAGTLGGAAGIAPVRAAAPALAAAPAALATTGAAAAPAGDIDVPEAAPPAAATSAAAPAAPATTTAAAVLPAVPAGVTVSVGQPALAGVALPSLPGIGHPLDSLHLVRLDLVLVSHEVVVIAPQAAAATTQSASAAAPSPSPPSPSAAAQPPGQPGSAPQESASQGSAPGGASGVQGH